MKGPDADHDAEVWDVLVIGAGPAGIATARALREAGITSFIVAERRHDVGGLWNYRSTAGEIHVPVDGVTFENCGASPMYKDLTTNLTKELMAYHDFPFPDEVPDFPKLPRTAVLQYYHSFAEAHGLQAHMEFETIVVEVKKDVLEDVWRVATCSQRGGILERKTRAVRFVVVANGHYACPRWPCLQGLESFPGRVMHSCSFDCSNEFDGQRVLVIGGSVSAGDLAKHILHGKPSAVYVSARQLPNTKFREITFGPVLQAQKEGAQLCGDVSCLKADGAVEFVDGTSKVVDVVICATGYSYSFPFLESASAEVVDAEGYHLKGLWKSLVYVPDPTLFFIGVQNVIIGPNQVFEAQARLVARVVREGPAAVLPSREVMEAEECARESAREPGEREFLGLRTGAYCQELSALAGARCTYRGPSLEAVNEVTMVDSMSRL